MKMNFKLKPVIILTAVFGFLSTGLFAQTKKIEVYTEPSCQNCEYSINYLKNNKIDYKEYSTSNSSYKANMSKILQAAGSTANVKLPVIVIDGKPYYNISNIQTFLTENVKVSQPTTSGKKKKTKGSFKK
jgi:glutaredoxin